MCDGSQQEDDNATNGYTTVFTVAESPEEVLDAINNVRGGRMLRCLFTRMGLLHQQQFTQPDNDR
jgi:hypothetical protein